MFGKNKQKESDLEFYTVYDSKAQIYAEPFPAPNKEVLLRDFLNAFKRAATEPQTNNRYYLNAEDFSIFSIGTFDTKTGTIATKNLEHVVNLNDIRAMAKPETTVLPTGH